MIKTTNNTMHTKKFFCIFGVLIFSVLSSSSAFSADHSATGKIAMMRSHGAYWNSNTWIQIEGLSGISGCEEQDHGKGSLTYLVVPSTEQQMYSMLLAAFMADKAVEVSFTTELTNGMCSVRFATLSQ